MVDCQVCTSVVNLHERVGEYELDGNCPVTLSVRTHCIENVFYVFRCYNNKFVTRLLSQQTLSRSSPSLLFLLGMNERSHAFTLTPLCTEPPTRSVLTYSLLVLVREGNPGPWEKSCLCFSLCSTGQLFNSKGSINTCIVPVASLCSS